MAFESKTLLHGDEKSFNENYDEIECEDVKKRKK